MADCVAPDSAIEFPGFVEDLESALVEAGLGIIPLRKGDDVKVKSVTMLGFGFPTVLTSIGVERLPASVCLVADGAADFAAALTQCREPHVRARLSREAADGIRRYVDDARPEDVFQKSNRARARATCCVAKGLRVQPDACPRRRPR